MKKEQEPAKIIKTPEKQPDLVRENLAMTQKEKEKKSDKKTSQPDNISIEEQDAQAIKKAEADLERVFDKAEGKEPESKGTEINVESVLADELIAHETAKKELLKLAVEIIPEKLEKLNIKENDLEQIEGFKNLSKGQQALALENLKQLTLGRIQEEALAKYKKDTTEAKFLKRIWQGVSKNYKIAKLEKTTAKDIREGGIETHKETLQQLVNGLKEYGPEVEIKDGQLEMQYISASEMPGHEKGVKEFNKVATKFSKIPREWAYESASKSEQKKYREAKNNYNKEMWSISGKARIEKGELAKINEIDYKITMNQFLNTHPDVEKQLQKIEDGKAWKYVLLNMATERGLYAGFGFLARTAAVGAFGLISAPITTALYGGLFAGKRAKRTLKEREVLARKGEKDTSKEKKKYSEVEKVSNKIKTLTLKLESGETAKGGELTDKQIKAYQKSLEVSMLWIEDKMNKGLIDFGKKEERVARQYDLIKTFSQGKIKSHYSLDTKYWERANLAIDERDSKTEKAQKRYLCKEILKGAGIAAGFALGGYALRHFTGEWFGQSKGVVKESIEPRIVEEKIPNIPKSVPIIPDEKIAPLVEEAPAAKVLDKEIISPVEKAVALERGIKSEFTLELGKGEVPAQLERVFHMMTVDHMDLGDSGMFAEEQGAKSLNMAANLVRLAEGKDTLGIKASEFIKAVQWDAKANTLEIKDHAQFNKIIGKLENHADGLWDKGALQKGAVAYLDDIKKGTWEKIVHAEGLDKVGEVETGITGHDEIVPDKIVDFDKSEMVQKAEEAIKAAEKEVFTPEKQTELYKRFLKGKGFSHIVSTERWPVKLGGSPSGGDFTAIVRIDGDPITLEFTNNGEEVSFKIDGKEHSLLGEDKINENSIRDLIKEPIEKSLPIKDLLPPEVMRTGYFNGIMNKDSLLPEDIKEIDKLFIKHSDHSFNDFQELKGKSVETGYFTELKANINALEKSIATSAGNPVEIAAKTRNLEEMKMVQKIWDKFGSKK